MDDDEGSWTGGDPCEDVLIVASLKEDTVVVIFPEVDREKLADELA